MTIDDISIPAGISLKKSLIEYVDNAVANTNQYKSRSEFISTLVLRQKEYARYDRFVNLFGTIFYPLVIFILFLGFTFTTLGFISTLFFFLSCFSGLIVIVMFFFSYMRYGAIPGEK